MLILRFVGPKGDRAVRSSSIQSRQRLPRFKFSGSLFKVLRGQPDGTFKKAEVLNGTNDEPLIIPVEGEHWIDDINSDGKFDILVGDSVTLISPANKLSEKEFKKKYAEWKESVDKGSKELNSTFEDEKAAEEARERFQKLYSERSEFMNEDSTGFVWHYLQK
jgi:hypothetical protein